MTVSGTTVTPHSNFDFGTIFSYRGIINLVEAKTPLNYRTQTAFVAYYVESSYVLCWCPSASLALQWMI